MKTHKSHNLRKRAGITCKSLLALFLFAVSGSFEVAHAQSTSLVSINHTGANSGNLDSNTRGSFDRASSDDGRFVAFDSNATDLVADKSNNFKSQVYVRDLRAGTTTLVSINRAGAAGGNGNSGGAVMSADGRFVAFSSDANDLVANDTNGGTDVFVRDLQAGTTTLVSVNRAGTDSGRGITPEPGLLSFYPVMSADGRWSF